MERFKYRLKVILEFQNKLNNHFKASFIDENKERSDIYRLDFKSQQITRPNNKS